MPSILACLCHCFLVQQIIFVWTNKLSLYPSVRYTIKISGGEGVVTNSGHPPSNKKFLPLPASYFKIFLERFLNDPYHPTSSIFHCHLPHPHPHPPPLPPIKIFTIHQASYFSINYLTLPSYMGVASYFCANHLTLPSSITFEGYFCAERLTLHSYISLALQL